MHKDYLPMTSKSYLLLAKVPVVVSNNKFASIKITQGAKIIISLLIENEKFLEYQRYKFIIWNLLNYEYISLTSKKNFLILNLWHDDLCSLGYSYGSKLVVGDNKGYICLQSFTTIGVMTSLRKQPKGEIDCNWAPPRKINNVIYE